MNKLELQAPATTRRSDLELDIPVQWISSERSNRLILLVPANTTGSTITRRICRLANDTESSIWLLGLYSDPTEELALRRELATMCALIREAKVFVVSTIERGTNWVEAIKHVYRSGDMIVCLADQTTGIRKKPLSQILESNFHAPIYILSETRKTGPSSKAASQITAWTGLLGIIVGFFLVQARIIELANGGFQTLLLLLVLIPEFWLIKVWNTLFF